MHETLLHDDVHASQLRAFIDYCKKTQHLSFEDYGAFETFAKTEFRQFWRLWLAWSKIVCEAEREPFCLGDDVETATFFPNVRLNYAENLLHHPGKLIGCQAQGT